MIFCFALDVYEIITIIVNDKEEHKFVLTIVRFSAMTPPMHFGDDHPFEFAGEGR